MLCVFEEETTSQSRAVKSGRAAAKPALRASSVHSSGSDPTNTSVCLVPVVFGGISSFSHGIRASLAVCSRIMSAFLSAISFFMSIISRHFAIATSVFSDSS